MPVNEEQRAELYQAFCDSVGKNVTNTLMEMLPPFDWSGIARKSDIDRLRLEMTGTTDKRFAEITGTMDMRFAEMTGTMDKRFAEMTGTMDKRFAEMTLQFAKVDAKFSVIEHDINRINRTLGWMIGSMVTIGVLIVGLLFNLSSQIAGLK